MNTLVVNMFGGPGIGKSTAAYRILGYLKSLGVNAEFASEYAKELVYEENYDMLDGSLEHQEMIFTEQKHRIDRLIGKVEVVVTDSPIFLSAVYAKEKNDVQKEKIINAFSEYNNLNIFLERTTESFDNRGRIHGYKESLQKDAEIKKLLDDYNIRYFIHNKNDIIKSAGTMIYYSYCSEALE